MPELFYLLWVGGRSIQAFCPSFVLSGLASSIKTVVVSHSICPTTGQIEWGTLPSLLLMRFNTDPVPTLRFVVDQVIPFRIALTSELSIERLSG
jgi:hypothetical protein